MDLEFLTAADESPMLPTNGKRQALGRTGVLLNVIAAATIACSFIQVLRGECTPTTVIQFWLSLFVAAAVKNTAGRFRSDAVEVDLGSGDPRAI
jgi:hypothetical protein